MTTRVQFASANFCRDELTAWHPERSRTFRQTDCCAVAALDTGADKVLSKASTFQGKLLPVNT